jgi:mannosyl-3-phosphoglycerate phosphatase
MCFFGADPPATHWPGDCTAKRVNTDSNRWIVATDLDGTLLDDRYPYGEAAEVIDRLCASDPVHVIIASSKTLAELLPMTGLCSHRPLLVFENGAGIAWPDGPLRQPGDDLENDYVIRSAIPGARPYAALCRQLEQLRTAQRFQFRGFADFSDAEIMSLTGLRGSQAIAARARRFTEPIVWQGDEKTLESFRAELSSRDLQLISGGRFLHVMPLVSKAESVSRLQQWLTDERPDRYRTLACGDAANDLTMLQSTDVAVVFPDPAGGYLLPESRSVLHAPSSGPKAWLRIVQQAISASTRIINSGSTQPHE